MPSVAAMRAASATVCTVLLQSLGRPSVARAMAARRPSIISRCLAYWIAPCIAGRVGVPPPGLVAAMAAVKAGATPGSSAMGTAGVAYPVTSHP
jgi:hypothetical protein